MMTVWRFLRAGLLWLVQIVLERLARRRAEPEQFTMSFLLQLLAAFIRGRGPELFSSLKSLVDLYGPKLLESLAEFLERTGRVNASAVDCKSLSDGDLESEILKCVESPKDEDGREFASGLGLGLGFLFQQVAPLLLEWIRRRIVR